ncbi:MAG: TonB-dependent receptor, partial [Acidaminococcaceae bacterium]|nr:TonB-dependent receptor [Acidaminococcaceae bacterium]
MKKLSKGMLMTALICGSIVPVLCGGASVYAAETEDEALSAFALDPMVVTATKVETKTLDIPASVEVINRERIENSGSGNAFEVLTNALGVMTHSQGVAGMSMGSMTSRVMIRGVEKGTLVMVNGVRINQDGKYNLEDIPAEAIDRIEIVRGGGAVLYGSEATGGVINIITKKKMKNSIKVEAGNYGRERYAGNFNFGKFSAVV